MPWVQCGPSRVHDRMYVQTMKDARKMARIMLPNVPWATSSEGVPIFKKMESKTAYDGVRFSGGRNSTIVAWHYAPQKYGVAEFPLKADGTVKW